MKLTYALAALTAALVLAGCENTRHARQLTPAQQEAVRAYRAEQRAEYLATMQTKMTDMDQKLAELGDTITSLEENAFAEEQFNGLRELRSQLDPLYDELCNADEAAWPNLKRRFDSAWGDLHLAYQVVKATYNN